MNLFRTNSFFYSYFVLIFCLIFFTFSIPVNALSSSDSDGVESPNYYTWKCDNSRTGSVSESGPDSPFVLWSEGFKEEGSFPPLVDGSPIYVDGKVYFSVWNGGAPAPFNALYCYDANTGERIWKNDDGQFRAGATYFDHRLYIGDLKGSLHCIDDDTGTTVWTTDSLSQTPWAGLSSTPLVLEAENGSVLIFVVGSKQYPYEGNDPSLAVLKDTLYVFEDTGDSYRLIDSVRPENTTKQSGSYIYSSVSSSPDGVVYAPGAGGVFAYNYNSGKILWSFDANAYGPMGSGTGTTFVGGNDICVGTPVYSDNKIYLCKNNSIYCINAKNGSQIWKTSREKGEKWSLNPVTPCVTDDKVIVTADGLNCYDKNTGQRLWRYEDGGPMSTVRSSALVAGDCAYFGTYSSGTLYSVKISDGSLNWKYVFPEIEAGWYSLVEATPLVRDGKLYVGSEDGHFYVFADPLYSVQYEVYDSSLKPVHINSDGVLNAQDSVNLPMPPVRSNEPPVKPVFSGWYNSKEGGQKIGNPGDSFTPKSDTILYGRWHDNSVENAVVTYKNGSDVLSTETVLSGSSPKFGVYVQKSGCAFVGWTFNGKPVSSGFLPTSDCTLKPNWKELPDINNDSKTDLVDVILLLQYSSGVGSYAGYSYNEMIASDLNEDGKIDLIDVILYLKSI